MGFEHNRKLAIIIALLTLISLATLLVQAEEFNFTGTWRGEYKPAAGATPAAAPATTAPPETGGGGGGRGGGGGGRGGGGGGGGFGGGGPQKVTLRVKISKDGKPSGNFTMGSGNAEDIREGKIEGSKLTFKTGLTPAPIYVNEAVLVGETLSVTRTAEGQRGGRPMLFELMRSK